MSECIFCSIISKKIPSQPIYEDESVIVIRDIHPQAPIHILIIPKTHYPEFLDVPEDMIQTIFHHAKKIITEQKISAYRLINNGKEAALIPHFHLHILGKVEKFRTL